MADWDFRIKILEEIKEHEIAEVRAICLVVLQILTSV
jgi:hypothetical protein